MGVLLQPLITDDTDGHDVEVEALVRRGEGSTVPPSVTLGILDDGSEPATVTAPGASLNSAPRFEADTSNVPLRARLVCAAVNFSVSMYATVTLAVMKLLHCVSVPGAPAGTTWLFIDATRQCSYFGWQAPLLVALALMCAMPLALAWLARWAMTGRWRWGAHTEALLSSQSSTPRNPNFLTDTRWGVHRALCGPYLPTLYFWESVLMAQRLVLAALSVFLSSSRPAVAVQAVTLLCVALLLLHVLVGPLHSPGARRLQTVLLFSLTAVALASSPAADRQEAASTASGPGAPSEKTAHSLRLVFGAVVPVVALVASFSPAPATVWARLRRGCSRTPARPGGVKQS